MGKAEDTPHGGPSPLISGTGALARGLATALPLLAIAACGSSPPPTAVTPPPLVQPAPPTSEPIAAPTPVAGLTPLPTPAQVVRGLGQGRLDPFAPVASAAVAATATDASGRPLIAKPKPKPAAQLPAGFSFSGVVSSRGNAQALVQVYGQTGPLCVGPRGFCPGAGLAPLLPPGWIVTAIDVSNGQLSLRQGSDRFTLTL